MSSNTKRPLGTNLFKPKAKKIISLFCTILGYKNDEEVDESVLGFLSQLQPITSEAPK